jgi:hypothetical protein
MGNHSEVGHFTDDGGLHERGVYWLNGFVPLAYQLKAAGISVLYPKCSHKGRLKEADGPELPPRNRNGAGPVPLGPVNPMAQVRIFIDAILASVNATDGWIGPGDRPTVSDSGHPPNGGIYWGRSNAIFALIHYAEAENTLGKNPAEFERVATVVKNYFLCIKDMLAITPLEMWSASRWVDMALSVAWTISNSSPTEMEMVALMELGGVLRQQGTDWGAHYAGIGKGELSNSQQLRHNVNNAQALKWSAVEHLFTGNASLRNHGRQDMANMDSMFGIPTGMFNGDEMIPKPPSRNPSRGIETCGVVEAMFSYTTLGAVHGDVQFFDRAERIAFNALPAAWASRRGGDMWNHPYLQSVNEVQAIESDPVSTCRCRASV